MCVRVWVVRVVGRWVGVVVCEDAFLPVFLRRLADLARSQAAPAPPSHLFITLSFLPIAPAALTPHMCVEAPNVGAFYLGTCVSETCDPGNGPGMSGLMSVFRN